MVKLALTIFQSKTEVFREGYDAYRTGKRCEDNPYNKALYPHHTALSALSALWTEGWKTADLDAADDVI